MYTKPLEDDPVPGDYTIFMAQSRRVGKDSKGEPVFALDEKGSATSELDEDLTQIAEAYKTFRDIGTFTESETCFTAERGELDDNLNLNPQHYSPELNATLEKVSKFDDKPDWSVTTIGQLDKNIRIYMGPRWSSRSLVVEDPSDTTNLTPYLTANGALEQRRMTVKWFDMSRATDKQKECVRMLRVQKGDILISRSGTIGKVTYARMENTSGMTCLEWPYMTRRRIWNARIRIRDIIVTPVRVVPRPIPRHWPCTGS